MADARVRGVLAALVLVLAACTSQQDLRKAELAELASWLPGRYDNTAQIAEAPGGTAREALAITIVPVYAPFLSDYVFYAEETAAGDPRRIFSQRLWAFDTARDAIVQGAYSLTDPARWRSGYAAPDLFKSLMPQDVKAASGCELAWKREDGRFVATNDRQRCRALSPVTRSMVSIEARSELTPDELLVTEQSFDMAGRRVGNEATTHRFRKGGAP